MLYQARGIKLSEAQKKIETFIQAIELVLFTSTCYKLLLIIITHCWQVDKLFITVECWRNRGAACELYVAPQSSPTNA